MISINLYYYSDIACTRTTAVRFVFYIFGEPRSVHVEDSPTSLLLLAFQLLSFTNWFLKYFHLFVHNFKYCAISFYKVFVMWQSL